MPIKSTRFKVTIDTEANCFLLSYVTEAGQPGDPACSRNITLFTWEQVQATTELALRGELESNAEVKQRQAAGKPARHTTETIEAYLARGGTITRIERKKRVSPPKVDDLDGWEKLLSGLKFEAEPPVIPSATEVGKPSVSQQQTPPSPA